MSGVEDTIARPGKLSYLQIPAVDAAALGAFYARLFAWRIAGGSPAHWSFADASGELIGAFVTARAPAQDGGPLPYIYVEDVAATSLAIEQAGGRIERAAYKEGALTVATFRDPAGNLMGVWSGS